MRRHHCRQQRQRDDKSTLTISARCSVVQRNAGSRISDCHSRRRQCANTSAHHDLRLWPRQERCAHCAVPFERTHSSSRGWRHRTTCSGACGRSSSRYPGGFMLGTNPEANPRTRRRVPDDSRDGSAHCGSGKDPLRRDPVALTPIQPWRSDVCECRSHRLVFCGLRPNGRRSDSP